MSSHEKIKFINFAFLIRVQESFKLLNFSNDSTLLTFILLIILMTTLIMFPMLLISFHFFSYLIIFFNFRNFIRMRMNANKNKIFIYDDFNAIILVMCAEKFIVLKF